MQAHGNDLIVFREGGRPRGRWGGSMVDFCFIGNVFFLMTKCHCSFREAGPIVFSIILLPLKFFYNKH